MISAVLMTAVTFAAGVQADEAPEDPVPRTLRALDLALDDLVGGGAAPVDALIRAAAAIRSHTISYATVPFVVTREERMVRAIVPAVLQIVSRPESDRQDVTNAIRAMDYLCGSLSSPDALRLFAPHVGTIAALIRARPHPGIHRDAVNWLGSLGAVAAPAFPEIVAVFESESAYDARAAASALGSIGERSWPYLRLALAAESSGRRLLALDAWEEAPPLLTDDFVLLARSIADADESVRRAAAWVVARHASRDAISNDARRSVAPFLRTHLSHYDAGIRRAMWHALASLAPWDPPLDRRVIDGGLTDRDWTVRREVVLALRRIVPNEVVVCLLSKRAADFDLRVCEAAAAELAAIGSAARVSIPTLVSLRDRERQSGREIGVRDVEAAIQRIEKSAGSPR